MALFCPSCGHELTAGIAYCPNCGTAIPTITTQPPETTTPYSYNAPTAPRTVKASVFFLVVGILIALLFTTGGLLLLQTVQTQQQLTHPTVEIWNSCGAPCTMTPNSWRAGGVPDTFDYHVAFNATVPVAVYFLTLSQYVQFARCGNTSCVNTAFDSVQATTVEPGFTFTKAEGCGSYVAVYQSTQTGVISPNISITYNPASQPTGACV